MPRLRSQSALIDHRLGMLDPEPNRKRLGFDVNTLLMQHLKRVTGTVSHSQDDMFAGDILSARENHTPHLPIFSMLFDRDRLYPTFKAKFTAQGFDRAAHSLDNFHQSVGA